MNKALRLWPLLTATHRYDKSLSTRNWPNHDIEFFRTLRRFPEFHS